MSDAYAGMIMVVLGPYGCLGHDVCVTCFSCRLEVWGADVACSTTLLGGENVSEG